MTSALFTTFNNFHALPAENTDADSHVLKDGIIDTISPVYYPRQSNATRAYRPNRVSTCTPRSVNAIVCSKCAVILPSADE